MGAVKKLAIVVGVACWALSAAPALARPGAYVNPFTSTAWQPSRIDMGVDWVPVRPAPVLAIGNAVILGSDGHSRWPGHHLIWYRLLDGSHAGEVIYVAEHLKRMLRAGTTVHAGQRIATALPGYPWTEWGFADQYGTPRAFPCYHEGKATNSGKEMARFLRALGEPFAAVSSAGADWPTGKRC